MSEQSSQAISHARFGKYVNDGCYEVRYQLLYQRQTAFDAPHALEETQLTRTPAMCRFFSEPSDKSLGVGFSVILKGHGTG